jgi:GT2 family glycosyltransferase
MRSTPLSIAMCTYNGALYLREQLESIAGQTRLPDELVVCDDRSTRRFSPPALARRVPQGQPMFYWKVH